MILSNPTSKSENDQITHIYMAVAKDDVLGKEGLCAVLVEGSWVPMLACDGDRLAEMQLAAERLAYGTGKVVKIIKLSVREDIMTFDRRH